MEYTKGTFKDGTTGWKAVPYPKERQVGFSTHEIHFSDDGECVAEVVHGEANAKLIAAAPELLKACINSLKDVQKLNKELIKEGKHGYVLMENELNDAIKKATE